MKGRTASATALILLLVGMFTLAFDTQTVKASPSPTESTTVVVPYDFLTIQEAINNAAEGDTVFVKSGIYYEHVVVNKTLSLVGESSNTTIIDGKWTGVVINVTRNRVTISGLTVRRSGSIYWENAGVFLGNVENCSISQNILTENSFAGLELNYSRSCSVSGNSILSNGGVGVTLVGGGLHDLSRNSFVENGWSALTLNDETNGNTISENNMTSNNQAVTDGYCINLYRSSKNSIQKNKITGDDNGIRLEYSSSFNTISQNSITNNNGNGIGVDFSSNNNMLSENIIKENGYYGIGLHSSSDNTISGNNITQNDGSGIWLDSSSRNSVDGNNIANNTGTGILVERNSNNNIISDNMISGSRLGLVARGSRYTEICNNTISHNYGGEWDAGIRLDSAGYTRIHSNLIVDNGRGIVLYTSSPHVSIYENNVTSNDYGIRVAMGGSSYVNVTGNYVARNRGYGIDVTGFGGGGGSNHATIARNLIVNNTFEAVGLGIGSSYNMVVQNTMIGNGHAGVTLERYSYFNTIVQNNIVKNAYGICFDLYIVPSTLNTIINNKIIDNAQQVRIAPGSVNTWNGNYPSGGNYWSDHVTIDYYSGANQDEPGSDGIVDEPYIIDANNRDNYPLAPISATLDIDPSTLTLESQGQWITAFIELPEAYSVYDIDVSSIMLNATIPAEPEPTAVCDHDDDGIPDLMIKFDRAEVASYVLDHINLNGLPRARFTTVTLTITGELTDWTPFLGSDKIKIICTVP